MVTEAQAQPRTLAPTKAWPPDDTATSILGIDLHQGTITNLRLGINEAAHLYMTPGQPVPWKATTQLLFLGCKRPNGNAYRTLPDLFVFPRPIDPLRGTSTLRVDGPPVLIIEVLSASTYKADLDLDQGMIATVYSHDGRRMLREGEIEAELARLRRLLDEQGAEKANLDK